MCIERMCIERMCIERMCIERMCIERMYIDKVCIDSVYRPDTHLFIISHSAPGTPLGHEISSARFGTSITFPSNPWSGPVLSFFSVLSDLTCEISFCSKDSAFSGQ